MAILAATWVYSFFICLSILLVFRQRQHQPQIDECAVYRVLPEACVHVFMANIWFVIAATIFIYIQILIVVRHQLRQVMPSGITPETNTSPNNLKTLSINLHVVKTFMMVVGIFTVCWIPSFLAMEADYIGLDRQFADVLLAFGVPQMMLMLNSLCNPVIYALKYGAFKAALKRLFKCKNGSTDAFSLTHTT